MLINYGEQMALSAEEMNSIINAPRERLDIELKEWFDPATDEGRGRLARACIALRNNNGGCLVVGFADDGQPAANPPGDIRAVFDADVVQQIVSKFASHPFEVRVEFVPRDGVDYAVVCVDAGVETPVAAKSDLVPATGPAIREHRVYVRSIRSNGSVSSTEAKWQDWERLVSICVDNREANIGRFIRRHLAGISIDGLMQSLQHLNPPVVQETAVTVLENGRERFNAALARRGDDLAGIGTREVAAVIQGSVPPALSDEDFLNRLMLTKPHHTGWSAWIDSRGMRSPEGVPYVLDGAWETFLVTQASAMFGANLDFWRIDPRGHFYTLQGLEDDFPHPRVPHHPSPGTVVDFLRQIQRVAEALSYVQSFARAMGCDAAQCRLDFAFCWSGLADRELTSWVAPERSFHSRGPSRQSDVISKVEMSLDTPYSAFAPVVEQAVVPLFLLFGGMRFDSAVIEGIVKETLNRRM